MMYRDAPRGQPIARLSYHVRMPRFAALLSALLCLLVLVDGMGHAHASNATAVQAVAMMDATRQPAAHDALPCHGDAAAGQDGAGLVDVDPGMPDCCESGRCDGFCTQHAAAAMPAPVMPLLPVAGRAPAYRMPGHVSAVLSHRHRPPILSA